VLLTSRTFPESHFENIVPANIGKTKKTFFLTVILTDTLNTAAPHPRCSVSGMRTDTAYGHARPPHPCRFAVLVHAGVGRCAGRWPSLCTMHAPLPCNCRCLISGSSRRLPSPGMRRPALNTCTRKHVPGPHPILARRLRAHLVLACQRFHYRMWLCNRLVLPLWGVQGVQDGSWERVLLHLRRKTGTGCVCHRLQNATERLIDTCVFVCALG
jgi:hypothetical protein